MDPTSPFARFGAPVKRIDTCLIRVYFCNHAHCHTVWKAPEAERCIACRRDDALEVLKEYRLDVARI